MLSERRRAARERARARPIPARRAWAIGDGLSSRARRAAEAPVTERARVLAASSGAAARFILIAATALGAATVAALAEIPRAPAPAAETTTFAAGRAEESPLVALSSPGGLARLERARPKQAFALLANHFEPQQNKFYCGPASATVVLNALRIGVERFPKPQDRRHLEPAAARHLPPGFDPVFARYTQETFFTSLTDRVKTRLQVHGEPSPGTNAPDYGVQLRQLDGMLRAHALSTTLRIVDGRMAASRVRDELSAALAEPDAFVIVNYHRGTLGQLGGGHISPLGAYDASSDSFLILDVNPNAGPWMWVPANLLIAAMGTRDVSENRGYVVVRESGARRPGAS